MRRKYILVFSEKNGITNISSKSDGFNAFEILGILDFKKDDIYKQLKEEIKPDIIKRKIVKD